MGWWPRKLRQSHLGVSQEGKLAIIDLQATKAVSSDPYILRLPDEILHNICDFCSVLQTDPDSDLFRDGLGPKTLTAVMLTCRRLYRVSQCFLYRKLSLDLEPTPVRTILFHRSLMASKIIGEHCKSLELGFNTISVTIDSCHYLDRQAYAMDEYVDARYENPNKNNWDVAERIVKSLPNVRKLYIKKVTAGVSTLPLFSNPNKYISRLHHLRIAHIGEDVLSKILQKFDSSTLRSMTLTVVYPCFSDERISQDKMGTSFITHLRLYHYSGCPEVLCSLIRWSRALEEFSFAYYADWDGELSFQLLFRMLSHQRFHLRRIELDVLELAVDTACSFDTSTFPELECLKVHAANVKDNATQAALALFRGPKQDTLVLDYSPRNQDPVSPVDSAWLELFIKEVGAQGNATLPKNRRIIVVTNSHFVDWETGEPFVDGWTGEPFVELARDVGIIFSYVQLRMGEDHSTSNSCRDLEDYARWKDIGDWDEE